MRKDSLYFFEFSFNEIVEKCRFGPSNFLGVTSASADEILSNVVHVFKDLQNHTHVS